MTEHTQTPWKWCGDEIEAGKYGELEVMNPSVSCGMFCYGGMVELCISDVDKRHIVRCVNYHNRLVEALHNMTKPSGGTLSDNVAALELLEELEQQP